MTQSRNKLRFLSNATECAAWHYPGTNGACVVMAAGAAVTKEPGTDKFAGVPHTPSPASGSPLLTEATAWIDCTIHAVHTGGDHLIVVGRVEALGTSESPTAPLLFHRGRFGHLQDDQPPQ